jgi:CHAT domain-containing protein
VIALGDPGGDLPASAAETARLGARFGARPHLGADATRASFAAASGADLLHVSAHARLSFDGAALLLADGPIAPIEIARLVPAPRLVVLASCSGSAGIDDAQLSLAGALQPHTWASFEVVAARPAVR